MSQVKDFTASFVQPANFVELRSAAASALDSMSFPTRKDEEWKYTRTNKLTKSNYKPTNKVQLDVSKYNIPMLDCYKAVFVNGIFDQEASNLPEEACSIIKREGEYSTAIDDSNIFATINQAYFTDGVSLDVAKGKSIDKPIHVIIIGAGENTSSILRHTINVEESAYAEIIFSYYSNDAHEQFNSAVLEANIAQNGELKIYKLQDENLATSSIHKEVINQEKDSRFSINTVTVGGKLVRNDLHINVNGQNCNTVLNGAYVTDGDQHVDNHSVVDHRVSNCLSNEMYKGVMAGKSTGVFNGKVFVRQDAQQTNAFQSNSNILVGKKSTINSKPELEIYADDVKCSHGSTTGQLDEQAMFYLRARGLGVKSARKILVNAFTSETLENIRNEAIHSWLQQNLDNKFDQLSE